MAASFRAGTGFPDAPVAVPDGIADGGQRPVPAAWSPDAPVGSVGSDRFAVEAVAGFDGGVEVVVLRRVPGGPWCLAGTQTVIDADTVAGLTGRVAPAAEPAHPLRDAVTAWLAEYAGPPARQWPVTDEQKALLTATFADAITSGQVRHR